MLVFLLMLWYLIGFVGGVYFLRKSLKRFVKSGKVLDKSDWIFISIWSVFGPVSVLAGFITYITNNDNKYFTGGK
jgi:hypothetical protein